MDENYDKKSLEKAKEKYNEFLAEGYEKGWFGEAEKGKIESKSDIDLKQEESKITQQDFRELTKEQWLDE